MAAADALLVDEWAHIEQPLPAHDLAADHPIERAAVAQLLGALGHHARPVHVLGREPAFPALLEFLADPVLEVSDRIAADAKLDEMKGHDGCCRTNCDEIIARGACVAMRAVSLSSEDGRVYCAGAAGRRAPPPAAGPPPGRRRQSVLRRARGRGRVARAPAPDAHPCRAPLWVVVA